MTTELDKRGALPAFPVSLPGVGDNGWHGMSLRDWFASQALTFMKPTGTLPRNAEFVAFARDVANCAYVYADAMLAARDAIATERSKSAGQ